MLNVFNLAISYKCTITRIWVIYNKIFTYLYFTTVSTIEHFIGIKNLLSRQSIEGAEVKMFIIAACFIIFWRNTKLVLFFGVRDQAVNTSPHPCVELLSCLPLMVINSRLKGAFVVSSESAFLDHLNKNSKLSNLRLHSLCLPYSAVYVSETKVSSKIKINKIVTRIKWERMNARFGQVYSWFHDF